MAFMLVVKFAPRYSSRPELAMKRRAMTVPQLAYYIYMNYLLPYAIGAALAVTAGSHCP
jgi:hypothetical protein